MQAVLTSVLAIVCAFVSSIFLCYLWCMCVCVRVAGYIMTPVVF